MSKISRKRRKRKQIPGIPNPAKHLRVSQRTEQGAVPTEFDSAFQERVQATQNLMAQYSRRDVAIALNVSDLWPENVCAPIKHIFAWCVLLGLGSNAAEAKTIESYGDFKAFVEALYVTWPEFPMLEDFTPEADWGQIRVRLGESFVPMFYGSCIERTPDYVEAFRITYANLPVALAQMDLVLSIQSSIIEAIPDLNGDEVFELGLTSPRTPPENFWISCRAALNQVAADTVQRRKLLGNALEISFGKYKPPLTYNTFVDAVMAGTALPFIGIAQESEWFPMSIRNAPGVLIDYWAAKKYKGVSIEAHRHLARFVLERFEGTAPGPLKLEMGNAIYDDLTLSCVVSATSGVYIICACDHQSISKVSRAVKRAYEDLKKGARMRFRFLDGRPLLLSKDGVNGPSMDETRVLLVTTQTSTAHGMLIAPQQPTRMMPVADFISIFDSLADTSELERYWEYVDTQRQSLSPFSTGPTDLFASFRDTHGVLIDGAATPTWIGLDPHWGTGWRFQELSSFWALAPRHFPDMSSGWHLAAGTEGVVVLNSRHHRAMAYSTTVGACTVQLQITISRSLQIADARMLDLFAQLLADSLHRSRDSISDARLFNLPHVLLNCVPQQSSTLTDDAPPEPLENFPLVVESAVQRSPKSGHIDLILNVQAILAGLNAASSGAFELRCLLETLATCHRTLDFELPEGIADRLKDRATEPARYHVRVTRRSVDVPDHPVTIIPTPTEYKLARKRLALEMKDLGLVPGRYELSDAKTKIDPASNRLRQHLERKISLLNRDELIRLCIEQHDALLATERHKILRARQSLAHAVEYDRLDAVEDARKEYGEVAGHYRYLLEKVVSTPSLGKGTVSDVDLRELVGIVNWYKILTGASDTLHNGIDVGGMEIDDSFIPEIFYSIDSSQREERYAREYAKNRLGIGINEQDAVDGASAELLTSEKLRHAFLADLGFELQTLLDTLKLLSQAKSFGFAKDLSLSYSAEPEHIVQTLMDNIEALASEEASKVVAFLTLSDAGIRRLAGKDIEEPDVPYWEHRKRIHRYAIRPLVTNNGELRWGAEAASRALSIWMSSVRDGYLPALFNWPNVEPVIKQVKEDIERRLEVRTEEIFLRHTPHVIRGCDFFKRFRNEGFEDVGDFDVLAFWPNSNTLVAVECKYNQPPFTVKDARRLRDQIFGKMESDRTGQFSRILRRRQFVESNRHRMIELLKWPTATDLPIRDVELYVSRDIHYWMIHTPYPVPTKFVRVDALDQWLLREI